MNIDHKSAGIGAAVAIIATSFQAFPTPTTSPGAALAPTSNVLEIDGIPSPRQLWRLGAEDGVFTVPLDKVLVITGAALRVSPLTGSDSPGRYRLVVDDVQTLHGFIGDNQYEGTAVFSPGYRVEPGSTVYAYNGGVGWEHTVLLGYLADVRP